MYYTQEIYIKYPNDMSADTVSDTNEYKFKEKTSNPHNK